MAAAAAAATLSLLPLLLFLTTSNAAHPTHNITKILAKHPSLSTFNDYLSKTHLASEINSRETITVLALDNAAMSSLLSKGFSLYTLRNVLSMHVLVDYFGSHKLHQISDGSTLSASLYQSSGQAVGNSGYVNITDVHGGKVGFAPADADQELHAYFVKSVEEFPYKISVIQISQMLDSAQAEAPTPEPSKVDLPSVLADKGCKAFSKLLTATGAAQIFQDNINSGLTVLCVGDNVMNAFMPKYKNLTTSGKQTLLLYHGIPLYNSMPIFKANNGAMTTLATDSGSDYTVTVQSDGEAVMIKTKLVTAKITGTLLDDDPLVCYKLDKVLMPRELFKGVALAPPPQAEAPGGGDAVDAKVADQTAHKKKNDAAGKINGGGAFMMVMALCYGLLAFV